MKKLSLFLFVLLTATCVAQGLYYYPQLPETVPSHFSLTGEPDAEASKSILITIYYGVIGVLAVLFLWAGLRVPRMPAAVLNMPNKEHWMSDERQATTRAFLSSSMFWLGSATMLLMLDVFHQSFRVGLGTVERMPHVAISLILFVAFVMVWTLGFISRFKTLS